MLYHNTYIFFCYTPIIRFLLCLATGFILRYTKITCILVQKYARILT